MNTDSTTLLLLIAGAVLIGLLLLGSPSSQPVADPVAAASSTATGVEPISRAVGAPTVNVGPDRIVNEREVVELQGDVQVPGGGAVSALWTADGGLGFFANARSPITKYTAPSACGCDESVVLTLTATSASGRSASDSFVLSVRDPLSCPTETYSTGGSHVTWIDPCPSSGARATCPATPSEPCASPCITTVSALECMEVPVPCPCSLDGCGEGWGPAWPLGEQPEHPRDRPKPRIGRQFSTSIREGTSMRITGYVSNPSCLSVCFVWSANKGWFEAADTLQPIYHAPESDRRDGETATVTLTVYDSTGTRSYDQIRFDIVNTDPK